MDDPTGPRRRPHRLDLRFYSCPELVFSITVGTSPRSPVFGDDALADRCRDLLLEQTHAFEVPLYAYCLMPDHVHLVVSASASLSVVQLVQRWKSLCCRPTKRAPAGRPFWQKGFWDHALRRDEAVLGHCRYVLNNPVRAGLVRQWQEYRWSGSEVFRLDR